MIFASSYFEFVRLRNYFKDINSPVTCISEYTDMYKAKKLMKKFKSGSIRYLLITERAYHFRICPIKGFLNIFFYSLPVNPDIYESLIFSIKEHLIKT